MTALVVEDFKTTLTESITFKYNKIRHIGGIKPKLLVYNMPAGTFTLSIKQGATTLASGDFTSADMQTQMGTTDNYFWLNAAVTFSGLVALKKGTYDLVLSSSGYTYSPLSFIAWVRSHENIFNERTDTFVDYTTNPFDVLIYENTREDLIR